MSDNTVGSELQNLDHLIPAKKWADDYTHRTLPGGHSDFDVFDSAHRLGHNLLLPGPSGSGKTTAARAYAAHLGRPYARLECSQDMSYQEVVGSVMADLATGLPVFRDGKLTSAVRQPSVILIDECNRTSGRILSGLHGLLDAEQTLYIQATGETVKKHPDCVIISAYNPGYEATTRLDKAFTNRFAYTIPWGYSAEVEDERVGQYSKTLLDKIRKLREECKSDIGTNTMEEFIDIAGDLSVEFAAFTLVNKLDPADQERAEKALEAVLPTIAAELGLDDEAQVDDLGGSEYADTEVE